MGSKLAMQKFQVGQTVYVTSTRQAVRITSVNQSPLQNTIYYNAVDAQGQVATYSEGQLSPLPV